MVPVLDVFVPDGDSREDTAVLLTGTAAEHDIPQSHVRASQGGFFISGDLADLVYGEDGPDPSGDTTGDNSTTEQE